MADRPHRLPGLRRGHPAAEKFVFLSFKFDDEEAAKFHQLIVSASKPLSHLTVVDARSLPIISGPFSTSISDFIRKRASGVICLFTKGSHGNRNILFEAGISVGAGKPLVIAAEAFKLVPSMLRDRVIAYPKSRILWEDAFKREIERGLRDELPSSEGQGIADKLGRRYSDEERHLLRDEVYCELPISVIVSGDLRKAIGILNLRTKTRPDDVDTLFLLSEAHYLRGFSSRIPATKEAEFELMLTFAERGLVVDSKNVLCLNAKLAAQMRLGELREAQSTLEKLRKLDDGFSVGLYNGACLGALCEKKDMMIELLTKAININPAWKDFAKSDPDFTAFKYDVDWQRLVYS